MGTFIALVTGVVISTSLRFFIFLNLKVDFMPIYTSSHFIFCALVGVFVPLFSALFAYALTLLGRIIEALSTLKISATSFRRSFKNLLSIRFSASQMVLSSLFLFYGLTFFYFVPRSFFYLDVFNFVLLMSFVLLLMFAGVGLLSTYLQIYLQLGWAKFFFCVIPAARRMKLLVQRNIKSNRSKNSQIFLLLNLVMLFIVYADTSFHTQLGGVYKLLFIRTGSDIRLSASTYRQSLKTDRLTQEIEKFNQKYGTDLEDPIPAFSFNCKALKMNPNVRKITFSNHIRYPELRRVNLKCLDTNYADSINAEFYNPSTFVPGQATGVFKQTGEKHGISSIFAPLIMEKDKFDKNDLIFGDIPYIENYFGYGTNGMDEKLDPTQSGSTQDEANAQTPSSGDSSLNSDVQKNIKTSLFSELREEINIMMPEGLMSILAMSAGDTGILTIETETDLQYEFFLRVSHTANTLPGTTFSSYSSRSRFVHDVFISRDNYQFIFNMIMNPHYYNFEEDYRVRITPLKTSAEGQLSEFNGLSEMEKAEVSNWVVDPLKLEEDGMQKMYYGKRKDDIIKLIDSTIKARIQVSLVANSRPRWHWTLSPRSKFGRRT